MASSLGRQSQRPRNDGAQMGTHPVIADFQAALQRGDPRAQQAMQLLSSNSPAQLQQIAMDMLHQRGLNLNSVLTGLGFKK